VKKSFSEKVWNFLKCDEKKLKNITMQLGVSDLVVRILLNRGFSDHSEIETFLGSKLKNTIPDPSLLLGMDDGIERVIKAISKNERIMVFGDYDVDGITSTCLIVKYLNLLGVNSSHYIPNRFTDGYGINMRLIEAAKRDGIKLLIILDSGVNSIEEIDFANKLGIDSIVIDHHPQLSVHLPKAVAVIDPNRTDQNEIKNAHIKSLCAAGVSLLFIIALQRELKRRDFFEVHQRQIPNLLDFADIVALGTLCDVMDMVGMNRAIVKHVLEKSSYSTGISSLMQLFNIRKISTSEDLSFFIGPAINAAGRVGNPNIALKLLLEESPEISQEIALQLIEFNKIRKNFEKELLDEATVTIERMDLARHNGICVYGDGWHKGVIGIIAGKIKDKYRKPTFVISFDKNGIGYGSARSMHGMHLGEFLEKAKMNGILLEGGGHALAGGFSISKNKIQEFSEFLNEQIKFDFVDSVDIDYSISSLTDLSQIWKELRILEPFGKKMEKPIFCINGTKIQSIRKNNTVSHITLYISRGFEKGAMRAMLFNVKNKRRIVQALEENVDKLLDVSGSINYNEQFGSSFIIEDIRLSD
jgi:single-stranded-DNA-specific exonuclease